MGEHEQRVTGRVLASPPKASLILQLRKAKTARFEELRTQLGMSNGALDYHLKDLAAAGVVAQTPEGQWTLSAFGTRLSATVQSVIRQLATA